MSCGRTPNVGFGGWADVLCISCISTERIYVAGTIYILPYVGVLKQHRRESDQGSMQAVSGRPTFLSMR